MDEQEGRRAAKRLGLRVVGVVGTLLDAKACGAVKAMRPHLDALRQTAGFYLSDAVYDDVLSRAGEADG
jgi:predicted nucleic acid-binding protein